MTKPAPPRRHRQGVWTVAALFAWLSLGAAEAQDSPPPTTAAPDTICATGAASGAGCAAIRARETVDATKLPWRAIGRVNYASTQIRGHCTGTLVGERVVLTAAHCLYNQRRKAWVPAQSVIFAAGYHRGQSAAIARGTRYVLAPEIDPDRTQEGGMESDPFAAAPWQDWGLLILDAPLGRRVGMLPLVGLEPEALWTAELAFAGYPALRAHLLSVERDCGGAELQLGGRLLVQQCPVMQGDSGGPVLAMGPTGPALVGLMAGIVVEGDRPLSAAVPVAVFAEALRAELGEGAEMPALAPLATLDGAPNGMQGTTAGETESPAQGGTQTPTARPDAPVEKGPPPEPPAAPLPIYPPGPPRGR